MASRENQGLQVALILLVMLTIGLCVTTFVFYSKASSQSAEAAGRQDPSGNGRERAKPVQLRKPNVDLHDQQRCRDLDADGRTTGHLSGRR